MCGARRTSDAWIAGRPAAAPGFRLFVMCHDEVRCGMADSGSDLLDTVLASSALIVFTCDRSGAVAGWSRGAERAYGFTAAEIVGQPAGRLFHPATGEWAAVLSRTLSGERTAPYESERVGRDQRIFHVKSAAAPLRDASGLVTGAAILEQDITDRVEVQQALRATEARWRAIVDSAVDGIVVINQNGVIEAFNRAAETMFGYSEQEVRGRNVNLLMPSPFREEHDGYVARYLATGVAKIIGIGREVIALRRDGSTFPVHLSVGEVTVQGERKFTGILHDLTARVQMETELREKTALARLGEMAAVIAHEVRNPLAGIRGAIQVMGSRLTPGGRDAEVSKEIIQRIDGLNELINDLLLFARQPQPSFAPVDVASLVRSTASLLAEDPALKEVRVEVSGGAPPISGDAELLKIVFVNLLVNAAQAMPGRGVIHVTVVPADRGCEVSVRDEGPGIPVEARDKLFTPFFTTKSRGTGLGLITAKRIVETHHGSIAVDSAPGRGTTVTVRLGTGN
jgi:two-component system sensor kinase FixL